MARQGAHDGLAEGSANRGGGEGRYFVTAQICAVCCCNEAGIQLFLQRVEEAHDTNQSPEVDSFRRLSGMSSSRVTDRPAALVARAVSV